MSIATKRNLEADGKSSLMFTKLRDHDRIAFEAYMAIYRNHGNHVILAAPSLDALADAWDKVCDLPLDRDAAQHVYVIGVSGAEG